MYDRFGNKSLDIHKAWRSVYNAREPSTMTSCPVEKELGTSREFEKQKRIG